MKAWVLIAAMAMGGCATWRDFTTAVDGLDGKPLQEVIRQLGYPTGEQRIAGMRLMHWDGTANGKSIVTQEADTTKRTDVSSSGCRITFEIDQSEIAHNPQIAGNKNSCQQYVRNILKRQPKA